MAQVAPKIARFELRMTIPDNTIENVFHVRCEATSWTETVMDATEAAFRSWWESTASPFINVDCHLYEILATDLTSLAGIKKLYPIDPPLSGGATGELLPANVSFALKATIATRGRGTSGRTFFPTIENTQVTNEQINLSAANALVTVMNTLISDINSVTGVDALVIPHFMVGGVRPPSVSASPVVSYSYSDLWLDSQRLRLPAHKKHKKKRPVSP